MLPANLKGDSVVQNSFLKLDSSPFNFQQTLNNSDVFTEER